MKTREIMEVENRRYISCPENSGYEIGNMTGLTYSNVALNANTIIIENNKNKQI